ncbi:MAG: TolC family protein [Fibrobacterota bacterium]
MRALLILTALLFFSHISAEVLTLAEAEKTALTHNLEIKKEELSKKAVKWEKWDAVAAYLPKLSYSNVYTALDDETYERMNYLGNIGSTGDPSLDFLIKAMAEGQQLSPQKSWQSSISINQPVTNGLKELIVLFQMAPAKLKLTDATQQLTKETVIINTRRTYYNIIKIGETVKMLEAVRDASERSLRKAEIRYRNGETAKDAFLTAEAQHESDKAEVISMKNNYSAVMYMLEDITGKEFSETVTCEPLENFEAVFKKALPEAEIKVEPAEIKMAEGAAEMAEASKNITASNVLPNINLSVSRNWLADKTFAPGDSEESNALSVAMNWSIGPGNLTSSEMAVYEARKSRIDLKISKRDLDTKIKTAHESLKNLKEKVIAAGKSARAQEESFGITAKRHEDGLVNTIDYINLSVLYKQKKIAYLEALFNYLNQLDEYKRLTGKLEV